MASDRGKNNNDLTTGDRLYDSGLSTDGSPLDEKPEAGDPAARKIDANYSTYAADAVAEKSDAEADKT